MSDDHRRIRPEICSIPRRAMTQAELWAAVKDRRVVVTKDSNGAGEIFEVFQAGSAMVHCSSPECATNDLYQTATDVTGRAWCIVCGKACS